ncbi:hypothetical protein EJ08DRAFT_733243 [Tothia fuscella]|uniref:AA1-like domain-containing protein n=1 Tax=Tothia fuscella TaxID=1048955 RepID=A0A9P4NSX3_9PEZI|nr:hypothetical protein EJ08DRAFT_733243 [Tothia fuscella]
MPNLSQSSLSIVSLLVLFITLSSAFPRDYWPRPSTWATSKQPQPTQKNATAPNPKTTTVTTEKSADCTEFPDPGYGGSDPDTYTFWPEASKIKVTCHLENFINGFNYTYLRATSGCYVDEMSVQAGNKDFGKLLPQCPPVQPYQVWTTKNEYLLPKDGFWMNCYKAPKKNSARFEVQWGARHVSCVDFGDKVKGDDAWFRDAHKVKGKEDQHCYVPADAFDNMVYELPGAGMSCDEFDQKKTKMQKASDQ